MQYSHTVRNFNLAILIHALKEAHAVFMNINKVYKRQCRVGDGIQENKVDVIMDF